VRHNKIIKGVSVNCFANLALSPSTVSCAPQNPSIHDLFHGISPEEAHQSASLVVFMIAAATHQSTSSCPSRGGINKRVGQARAVSDKSGNITSNATSNTMSIDINALGQRVRKTAPVGAGGGGTRHFMYDEAGRLVSELDASGKLIQETVWFNDLPIATLQPAGAFSNVPINTSTNTPTNPPSGQPRTCVVTPANAVDVFYIHADHLGTPRVITRPTDDRPVWEWANTEAFGKEVAPKFRTDD
jgi:hypothetical protein